MRVREMKKLILPALLAVLFVFAVQRLRTFQSERDEFRRDKLSDVALALAGANATDCGRVAKDSFADGEYDVMAQQEAVDGCVVAAFKAHKPFIARFDAGTSARSPKPFYQAYVGTKQGKLYVLSTAQPNIVSTIRRSSIDNPKIINSNGHNQLK